MNVTLFSSTRPRVALAGEWKVQFVREPGAAPGATWDAEPVVMPKTVSLPGNTNNPATFMQGAWLEREVAARDIRGVILARQVWCDKWHAEVHRFQAWLKVPLLDVDLDGQPCGARTRTRIQAFMESLR